MDLFEFDDVVVRFGDDVALDHVTASVPDGGAITCLLGASGSGKSTLLRLCNRLEVPASGTVRFRGRSLDDIDPLRLRRSVGMVFQRPTPFPGSVRDNFLVADPQATEQAMRRVLDQVHLPLTFLDREADSLSGGEAQRACLARTLITEPEVLLMDEPTSALDPTATRALEELGRELADDGMPILWVTHDLDQADRIADRRIVLVGGRLADEHQVEHYLASEEAFHHHHGDETHEGHAHDREVDDGRG
ncbi:MAG: phosphate ABC transporter ATP-binding protein [Acidimicrobiia bacterium]